MSSQDEKNKQNDSFLGVKFYTQKEDNSNNILGIQTYTPILNKKKYLLVLIKLTPAFFDLLNKLENAVKSNKFDRDTLELYRQISQISTIDGIVRNSPSINMATISTLREKEKEFTNEQNNNNLNFTQEQKNSPQTGASKIIDDDKIRQMQAEFLDSRNNYKTMLDEKQNNLEQQNKTPNNNNQQI